MINLASINLSGAGTGSGGGGQVSTPNVTIFGAPTINGAQVGGFSVDDYLQMPRVIDFAGKKWQLDFQFTTGADVAAQQNIVDSGFGLAIAVSQGKMLVALSSNGTSWDLGAHAGTHAVAANATYFVRMTFDGSKYVVAICQDHINYKTDITVSATASLYPRVILIGKSTDSQYVFGGSINLAEATLYIDGEVVWTGMTGANYATKNEVRQVKEDMAIIAKLANRTADSLGHYTDREPIVLTLEENNKAINRAGVKVDKAGWAICSFVGKKGDLYSFNPGTMDGDVCIFSEEITKRESRPIEYRYVYDEDGNPLTASATYNGAIHSYTWTYERDEDGNIIGETITDDQTGATIASLPYQYQSTVGTYHPLTILNESAELPEDHHCRLISHFQGEGTIRVTVSFHVATADMNLRVYRDGLIANLATQLGTIFQMISETNKALALVEALAAENKALSDHLNRIVSEGDRSTLPLLCGQPMILFGAGTPQEAIVPENWRQYDPVTGDGYQWNGTPSALGQVYINTAVTTNGRYTAVPNGEGNLKWLNF